MVSKVKAVVLALLLGLMLSLFYWCPPALVEAMSLGLHQPRLVQRDITYSTIGDVPLKMDVYCCQDRNVPGPAVVYIHGGGWYSGDKARGAGQWDIPELVAHGYLVASVNYRLAPRYKFPSQIEDVKCAIRFLRANADAYGIDPRRIGVFGDSAGGHLAALAGVTDSTSGFGVWGGYHEQSDRVQAVVDMCGPSDLTLIYQQNNSMHIEHVFGTADPSSPIIRQASPITHISVDDPPFLILHGDQDDEVRLEQSEILYRRLRASGVQSTLMVVNNGGHGFEPVGGVTSPTRKEITRHIVGFFDRQLKRPEPTIYR